MLRLRKAHPCGGSDWEVVRLGADIRLRCLACGRRVLLERATVERRVKALVSRGAGTPPGTSELSPDRFLSPGAPP